MADARTQVTDPKRWAAIRLLATDVDGVMTDGAISISSDGRETKAFHVRDGWGLLALRRAGLHVAWISGRRSEVTELRGRELGIPHLYQGTEDKGSVLRRLLDRTGVDPAHVCYCGDDTNDLGALSLAGIAATVADAHPEVLRIAHHVTAAPGGRGAVRELCDLILAHRS